MILRLANCWQQRLLLLAGVGAAHAGVAGAAVLVAIPLLLVLHAYGPRAFGADAADVDVVAGERAGGVYSDVDVPADVLAVDVEPAGHLPRLLQSHLLPMESPYPDVLQK